jgi:uncharacterized protein
MLRDDRAEGEGQRRPPRNVLGEPLEGCSIKPMTGFYRDGCCNTGQEDIGSHTVCVVMTSAFLNFRSLAGMTFRRRYRNSAFRDLNPETDGAYARLVGRRLLRRTTRPA